MKFSGYYAQINFSTVSHSSVLKGRSWFTIEEMSDAVDKVYVF